MLIYAVRKLVQIPVLLFGVVLAVFVMVRVAPGDPVATLIGEAPASAEYVAELREYLGIDRPIHEQFVQYIGNLLQGDLGTSYYYSADVLDLILARLPPTLFLMLASLIFATVVGVFLGVAAAARVNSPLDAAANVFSVVGYSLPVFWLGELTLLAFALHLNWFPSGGMSSVRDAPEGLLGLLDNLRHLTLPALVLATRYIAIDFRLTRSEVLEVLSQDYILWARAKGLPGRLIMFRHALRNALLPVVTITGLNVGFALSGAVLTEVVFSWPGLGRLTLDAITHRDYPVLTGIFLFVTFGVVVVNFLTDLLYAAIDPRIRLR